MWESFNGIILKMLKILVNLIDGEHRSYNRKVEYFG